MKKKIFWIILILMAMATSVAAEKSFDEYINNWHFKMKGDTPMLITANPEYDHLIIAGMLKKPVSTFAFTSNDFTGREMEYIFFKIEGYETEVFKVLMQHKKSVYINVPTGLVARMANGGTLTIEAENYELEFSLEKAAEAIYKFISNLGKGL